MSLLLASTTFVEATWILIVKSIVIFAVIFAIVPMLTVLERKLLGRFQARYGPNRVGPMGLLQPLADAIKLISKEHYHPRAAIPLLYYIAPAIVVFTGVATLAIIPFGNVQDGFGLYGIDVPIGILYFFAFGSIAFYGLLLGGWASGSKYSFLGAMRAAAQLISYEISMGLALLGAIMMAGSLSLVSIVEAQNQIWYVIPQFVGFLIFMVAGFAETNRAPFDLPEADAELVAGYGTEYGGMRYGSYAMAEYIEMFVISAVAVTFFLGGWHGPGPGLARPDLGDREDLPLPLPVHVGARHPPPGPLRPADVARLEGAAAARHPERAGDGDPGDDHMSKEFPYLEDESVVAVQRGPEPGGVGGAYRAFGETLRGLKTTFARIIEGPVTIQYPEEKTPVYPRFRGRHKLHKFEDTGLEKCVGCSLCAAACPADCIRVVAAENDPDDRVSAGERYAEIYEINLARCIFCGYCEVACPFDAITMGHEYEMADYNREDLVFTKEMLLAESVERTPLRREGE